MTKGRGLHMRGKQLRITCQMLVVTVLLLSVFPLGELLDMPLLMPAQAEGTRWDYTMDTTGPYNWIDATGGTKLTGFLNKFGSSDGDDGYKAHAIPFEFKFYNTTYAIGSQLYIGTNGHMGFDPGPEYYTDYAPGDVPSSDADSQKLISPFWEDFSTAEGGGGGDIYVLHNGGAQDPYFVVEYNGIKHFTDDCGTSTFEAIFYESGKITFQFAHVGCVPAPYLVAINDGTEQKASEFDSLTAGDINLAVTFHPPDLTPPTVLASAPATPSTPQIGVEVESNITFTFSEPMDTASVENYMEITPDCPGQFFWNATNETLNFTPTEDLRYSTEYIVRLDSNQTRDAVGNPLDGDEDGISEGYPQDDYIFSFTTEADTYPPYPVAFSPTGSKIGVETEIRVAWNEIMSWESVNGSFSLTDGTSVWTAANGTFAHNPVVPESVFTPGFTLEYNTTYWATFDVTAKDTAGNQLDNSTNGAGGEAGDELIIGFRTKIYDIPPRVLRTGPQDRNSDVPMKANITILFDQGMDTATVEESLRYTNGTGNWAEDNGSFLWNSHTYLNDLMTFNPDENFNPQNNYYFTLNASVAMDIYGNLLDGNGSGAADGSPLDDYLWNFTTGTSTQDVTPPIAGAGQDGLSAEDSAYSFDGTGSWDNVWIASYSWDFDASDGFNWTSPDAAGETPGHVYTQSGAYTVTLNVTDEAGLWDLEEMTVTVLNLPPTVDAGDNLYVDEGMDIPFSANTSDTPSDADTLKCFWFFGDNTTAVGKLVNHTYADDGSYTVTLLVIDDDGASAADTLEVVVKNLAPIIAPIPKVSINASENHTFYASAQDSGNDSITFGYISDFPISIDQSTGAYTLMPQEEDIGKAISFWLAASDGKATTIILVEFDVINKNDAPVLGPLWSLDKYVYQDNLFELDVNASDKDLPWGDHLNFSVESDSLNNSLFKIVKQSEDRGTIRLLPGNDDVGIHNVTVFVHDNNHTFDYGKFVLHILNRNDPPTIEALPPQTAVQGVPFYLKINASDPDLGLGDILVFSDSSELFDIDPETGEINFTPDNEDVGNHIVTIRATDEGLLQDDVTFTVRVQNVNDAPKILDIPQDFLTIIEDTHVSLNLGQYILDVDEPPATITIVASVVNASYFSQNGSVLILHYENGGRDDTLNLEVSDGELTATRSFRIIVLNVNDPPKLDPITRRYANEDERFYCQINASDDDGDVLVFFDNSTLFDIDPVAGTIDFVPENEDVGTHFVRITALDGNGGESSFVLELVINNTNDPPTIVTVGKQYAIVGKTYQFRVLAVDYDAGDNITFSDDSNIFDIDRQTGWISFVPGEGDKGEHLITITVTDGNGTTDSLTFTLQVEDASIAEVWPWLLLIALGCVLGAILGFYLGRKRKDNTPKMGPETSIGTGHGYGGIMRDEVLLGGFEPAKEDGMPPYPEPIAREESVPFAVAGGDAVPFAVAGEGAMHSGPKPAKEEETAEGTVYECPLCRGDVLKDTLTCLSCATEFEIGE